MAKNIGKTKSGACEKSFRNWGNGVEYIARETDRRADIQAK
jgi:hypothetical protein